jgi:hypothetical protein
MKIAGIICVRDEEDIIERTLENIFDQGVDHVYCQDDGSADGTLAIVRDFAEVTAMTSHSEYFWQASIMNGLSDLAHNEGATWIVPFDADEFWRGTEGRTLRQVIEGAQEPKLVAKLWNYTTPEMKIVAPERLPKVAFRWQEGVKIAAGNHDISIPGGEPGLIEILHLPYRGFEQFKRKVRFAIERLDPQTKDRGVGIHHTALDGATEDEMRDAWQRFNDQETVRDPMWV